MWAKRQNENNDKVWCMTIVQKIRSLCLFEIIGSARVSYERGSYHRKEDADFYCQGTELPGMVWLNIQLFDYCCRAPAVAALWFIFNVFSHDAISAKIRTYYIPDIGRCHNHKFVKMIDCTECLILWYLCGCVRTPIDINNKYIYHT